MSAESASEHLQYDPITAIQHLSTVDEVMGGLIHRIGPCDIEIRHLHDPFQTLMRSITFQQLSGKAAETIYGRVVALFDGDGPPDPAMVLDVDFTDLRGAGLSNNKALAIQDLASKTIEGIVPALSELQRMSDEEIIERLTTVRGIGKWTVEMLLIFRLGRPDVFPIQDLGVRKGYTKVYGLDALITPKKLEAAGEAWRPYRSVATWYLWRAADMVLI